MFEQYSAQAAREAELATYYAHKARERAVVVDKEDIVPVPERIRARPASTSSWRTYCWRSLNLAISSRGTAADAYRHRDGTSWWWRP